MYSFSFLVFSVQGCADFGRVHTFRNEFCVPFAFMIFRVIPCLCLIRFAWVHHFWNIDYIVSRSDDLLLDAHCLHFLYSLLVLLDVWLLICVFGGYSLNVLSGAPPLSLLVCIASASALSVVAVHPPLPPTYVLLCDRARTGGERASVAQLTFPAV